MGQAVPATMGATPCHGYGGNQMVKLNTKGQMTQGEWCKIIENLKNYGRDVLIFCWTF